MKQQQSEIKPFTEFFQKLEILDCHPTSRINLESMWKFIRLVQCQWENITNIIVQSQNDECQDGWKQLTRVLHNLQKQFMSEQIVLMIDHQGNEDDLISDEEIVRILKSTFVIATKSNNHSFFITKIMQLSETSQLYFANLLKPLCPTSPGSPFPDNPEIGSQPLTSQFIPNERKQIEMIDRLFQYEQQIQRHQLELKKVLDRNSSIQQQNRELRSQIKNYTRQNEQLGQKIIEQEQIIDQMNAKQEDNKNKFGRENNEEDDGGYKKQLRQYRDEIDILILQKQSLQRKYQAKISQLQQQAKNERQKHKKYKDKWSDLQEHKKKQLQVTEELTEKINAHLSTIQEYTHKIKKLQDDQMTLKFQLNYKNSQIEELKELLMNNSTVGKDTSVQFFAGCRSKLLQNQFDINSSSQNYSELTQDALMKGVNGMNGVSHANQQQLRELRIIVKDYEKQIESLKNLKVKNKQLQYEKKKLLKILKEFQTSRGEQNQIIVGCLYEIHHQISHRPKNSTETSGETQSTQEIVKLC